MINIEEFKKVFNQLSVGTEIVFSFNNKDDLYMLVKLDNKVSFLRCGDIEGSKEFFYETLDKLLVVKTVDDIVLSNEWSNIGKILINGLNIEEAIDIYDIVL